MASLTQLMILRNLERRRRKSTTDIQRILAGYGIEISLRSVQRNLDVLHQAFPIETDGRNPAGWKWMADAPVEDLPAIDATTALTLRMVQMYLEPLLPRESLMSLQPYMKRAEALLEERKRRLAAEGLFDSDHYLLAAAGLVGGRRAGRGV